MNSNYMPGPKLDTGIKMKNKKQWWGVFKRSLQSKTETNTTYLSYFCLQTPNQSGLIIRKLWTWNR